jgi:hypothetical protein
LRPACVMCRGEVGQGTGNFWVLTTLVRYTMKRLFNYRGLLLFLALAALGGCGGGGGGGSSTPPASTSTTCVLDGAGVAGTLGCTLG